MGSWDSFTFTDFFGTLHERPAERDAAAQLNSYLDDFVSNTSAMLLCAGPLSPSASGQGSTSYEEKRVGVIGGFNNQKRTSMTYGLAHNTSGTSGSGDRPQSADMFHPASN